MEDELRKSLNSTIKERIASPFWGAIILSWLAWNWRLVYFTLFASSEKLDGTKFDYVKENFDTGITNFLLLPLGIAFLIIVIVPVFSNGAYWLNLYFSKWRIEKKNQIERKILLTVEESIKLRSEILNQEGKFRELMSSKDDRIIELIDEIRELREKVDQYEVLNSDLSEKYKLSENELVLNRKRNVISDVFRGEWIYEVVGKEKKAFNIQNENRFYFEDNRNEFDTFVLSRGGRTSMKLLLLPRNFDEKKDYQIFLIDIYRQKTNIYEGKQWLIEKNENELVVSKEVIKLYE